MQRIIICKFETIEMQPHKCYWHKYCIQNLYQNQWFISASLQKSRHNVQIHNQSYSGLFSCYSGGKCVSDKAGNTGEGSLEGDPPTRGSSSITHHLRVTAISMISRKSKNVLKITRPRVAISKYYHCSSGL